MHLSKVHFKKLFGEKANLHSFKAVSQPGQYAAQETVAVSTKKHTFSHVRVVGPCRPQTQLEITRTDAHKLGIDPPLKRSGLLPKKGTVVTIKGPRGALRLLGHVIIAQRHIHASPEEAKKYGLKNKQKVQIAVSGERGGVFDNVVVRVHPKFKWAFQIDTDEANAFGVREKTQGIILFS